METTYLKPDSKMKAAPAATKQDIDAGDNEAAKDVLATVLTLDETIHIGFPPVCQCVSGSL